jgi:hypothetical protein
VVRDVGDLKFYLPVRLPGVKQTVGILAKLKGRRIDLMRRACYNLEKMNGFDVYRYSTRFWQRVACLLDDYDGHWSGAVKSNLRQLSERYGEREQAGD